MPSKLSTNTKHRFAAVAPVLLMAIVVTATGLGCAASSPSVEFIRQAQLLHDGALADAVTANSDLRDYLQLVGHRVGKAAQSTEPGRAGDPVFAEIQFHLVAGDVPNVFTTGGMHIYLTNRLFQLCQSEDQLAAAFSHAFSHAVNLDVERIDIHPNPNASVNSVAWQFISHRFTLAQEQAADKLAYAIYIRAGYDPAAFAGLFARLADAYPDNQAPDRTPLIIRAQDARRWAQSTPTAGRPFPVADPRTFLSLRQQSAKLDPRDMNPLAALILRAWPNCMLSGDTPQQQAAQRQLRPVLPAHALEPS